MLFRLYGRLRRVPRAGGRKIGRRLLTPLKNARIITLKAEKTDFQEGSSVSEYRSREDYLEAILVVEESRGSCRSIDVATQLGFSKPSVSIAMGKLESEGFITRDADGTLLLTAAGRTVAEQTLEKHRFLTAFLRRIGVSDEVAESDACRIEHNLSEESYEKLRAFLTDKQN